MREDGGVCGGGEGRREGGVMTLSFCHGLEF